MGFLEKTAYRIVEPAGPLMRASAYLIDVLVIYAYIAVLFAASTAVNSLTSFHEMMEASYLMRHSISFLTLTLPVILYFTLMERSRRQASFGKSLLGMRVESVTGERAPFSTLLTRNAVKFLPWEIAHTHIHLTPNFIFTGETSTVGWILGVVTPLCAMLLYAGMIIVRDDRRSVYELISGTRTVRTRPSTDSRAT